MLKRILVLAVAIVGLAAAPALADDEPQYPPQDDLKISVSATALCPGDSVTISGEGFAPGSSVVVELAANETTLGSATADGAGAFSLETTIPDTQAAGDYTVTVSGSAADGSDVDERAALEVQDCEGGGDDDSGNDDDGAVSATPPADDSSSSGNLPVTGSNSTMTLIKIGLALAAIGGALLAWARRRRRVAALSPA
jgi:LPXTG-motif cell wall-anchored protein